MMSRSTFPLCVSTAACIAAILSEQKTYDEDPEEYERWERIKEQKRRDVCFQEQEVPEEDE